MNRNELEEKLALELTGKVMPKVDAQEAARKRLPIKTEIHIQAVTDPVVEETKQYRRMAKEVDDRYERFDKLIDGIQDKRQS